MHITKIHILAIFIVVHEDSKFHNDTKLSMLPVSCRYLFLVHSLHLPVRSSRNFGWTGKSRHDFVTVLTTVE